ncbi:hypothetical protein F5880DRAFT_1090033 [Lentinula raphanica]|nr:hypothetical protein F5880DRAFT_1090033 [Lentinula raphanica]
MQALTVLLWLSVVLSTFKLFLSSGGLVVVWTIEYKSPRVHCYSEKRPPSTMYVEGSEEQRGSRERESDDTSAKELLYPAKEEDMDGGTQELH